QDPRQPHRHWDTLSLGTNERATRLPPQVVGGIDIALWDITGKAAGMPVHMLLGGAARKEIPLYWSQGSGWKKEPEEMLEDVQRGWQQGFRYFKIRMDWRDYRQDADPAKDYRMFRLCRDWLPGDIWLGFDANNGYSVSTAILQGLKLEEHGAAHFEEPLAQYDLPGLKQVVDALALPISTGEQETSRWRFRDLVDLANPDILQPDILNVGGVSEMKRVYDMAAIRNKPVMPHSPTAGINSLASLHAYSTVTTATRPHEFSDEFVGDMEQVAELFNEPVLPKDGVMRLSDRPGFGLTLNESAVEKAIVE
ncbi:MAG: mandelate racemase/muconate lactonizing enzyme family protein, partial [Chloroflexota bacterium]